MTARRLVPLLSALVIVALLVWSQREERGSRAEREDAAAVDSPVERVETPEEPPEVKITSTGSTEYVPPPPDPRGKGDVELDLRVVDADTNESVKTEVVLWRLDAPETEHWTRGDQRQVQVTVPDEGLLVSDLPPGRYRAVVFAARNGDPDPPEFGIAAPRSEATLVIRRPGRIRARCKVVDERGAPVATAWVRHSGSFHNSRGSDAPEWRVPRKRKNPPTSYHVTIGIGGGYSGAWSLRRVRERAQPPEGFDLGPHNASTRGSSVDHNFRLGREDCNEVGVAVSGDEGKPRALIGVSAPLAPIRERILLPDGRLAVDAGARITGVSFAVPDTPHLEPGFWLRVPIRVRVRMSGFKELGFDYKLGEALPTWTLEPASQKETAGDG